MTEQYYSITLDENTLQHYGVKGMKWGVRRAIRKYNNAVKKLKKREVIQKRHRKEYRKVFDDLSKNVKRADPIQKQIFDLNTRRLAKKVKKLKDKVETAKKKAKKKPGILKESLKELVWDTAGGALKDYLYNDGRNLKNIAESRKVFRKPTKTSRGRKIAK